MAPSREVLYQLITEAFDFNARLLQEMKDHLGILESYTLDFPNFRDAIDPEMLYGLLGEILEHMNKISKKCSATSLVRIHVKEILSKFSDSNIPIPTQKQWRDGILASLEYLEEARRALLVYKTDYESYYKMLIGYQYLITNNKI